MIEYELIQTYYGFQTAERSQVPLINHIDEGLQILEMINASRAAKRAYCLHPMVQEDDALEKNWLLLSDIESQIMLFAIEYRNIANQYLSIREIGSLHEIRLSPLVTVNHMLVADKVQNYKDFRLYHYGKHERSEELNQYFHNWFIRLNLTVNAVEDYIARLSGQQGEQR